MEITAVRAAFLDVNCYAVAAESTGPSPRECVLVDAGSECAPDLARVLADLRWEPVAILLTHGHLDHVLGLPALRSTWDVPVHIGAADAYRLTDPAAHTSAELAAHVADRTAGWTTPAHVPVASGTDLEFAGLRISATEAPGHTEGSTLWRVTDPQAAGTVDEVLFTGDVLFAGSVGRTDLPGGDPEAMQRTIGMLRTLPDTPVLPGHGPLTQLSREIETNPFF